MSSITPDLLNDALDSQTGWNGQVYDSATCEILPAGQLHLAGNGSLSSRANVNKSITIPTNFTQEISCYLDAIGTDENHGFHWQCNNGSYDTYIKMYNGKLFYYDGSDHEIGSNLAPTGQWIIWRLESTNNSVQVYKNGISVGTVTMAAGSDANRKPFWQMRGYASTATSIHIEYVKIGTGIGDFNPSGGFFMFF